MMTDKQFPSFLTPNCSTNKLSIRLLAPCGLFVKLAELELNRFSESVCCLIYRPPNPTQSDRPLQRRLIQQQTASSRSSEAKSSVFRMNTGDAYQEEVVQKDLGAKNKSTKGPLQAN